MGELPAGQQLSQRDLIEFMVEMKNAVSGFKEKLGEFKDAIDALADRNDLNADTIRDDFQGKLKAVEQKQVDLEKDVAKLKEWRLSQAGWVAGALAIVGLVWLVASKIMDKLIK